MSGNDHWLKWFAVSAIGLGVVLRLVNVAMEPSLWADEVFSVALAQSPLLDVVLLGLRFDTHPPLYYLQLHLWGLLGTSDVWFIVNSTLLSMLAGLSIWLTCHRIYGERVALWATALYALLPLQLYFAENVRMYPMVAILQVWLWYVLERRVEGQPAMRGLTVGLGLALALSHGLGFFVAFFLFLQAFLRMRFGPAQRTPWALVADGGIVALTAAWPLAIAVIRRTEGVDTFDLQTIGVHMALTLLGMDSPMPEVTGFVALLVLIGPPLLHASSRKVVLTLVVLPWFVLLLLSLAVKPVFIFRTLGLFLPFLAIGFGLFAAEYSGPRRVVVQGTLASVLLMLAASGVNYTLNFEKSGYREVATIWSSQAPLDATLFAAGPSDFWGITRYLPEVPLASALAVQPPVRGSMMALKSRLEGTFLDRAGFFGRSHWVAAGSRKLYPAFDADVADAIPVFWLLNFMESCESLHRQTLREYRADGQHLQECSR